MILPPINDATCLGALTDQIRSRIAGPSPDRSLAALARELGSTAALVRWLRELPQRDDLGAAADGPRVDACTPTQRFRMPAPDPNCVERAATYVAVAELIDPRPQRQLSTALTPAGFLHTFPVEDGAVVVLDPVVSGPAAVAGTAGAGPRNGRGPRRFLDLGPLGRIPLTPPVDRALRVVARAAVLAGPSLAEPAARVALQSFGISPDLVRPIELALNREGLTLGLPARPR